MIKSLISNSCANNATVNSVTTQVESWQFADRYAAQQIVPKVFLGPSSLVDSESFIEGNNIRVFIACMRAERAAMLLKKFALPDYRCIIIDPEYSLNHFKSIHVQNHLHEFTQAQANIGDCYPNLDIQPIMTGSLMSSFAVTNDILANVVSSQDYDVSAYVFCESGNDKSAAIICSLLMDYYKGSFEESYRHIQSQRLCVNIEGYYRNILLTYQEVRQANYQVHVMTPNPSNDDLRAGYQNNKRCLEESEINETPRAGTNPLNFKLQRA